MARHYSREEYEKMIVRDILRKLYRRQEGSLRRIKIVPYTYYSGYVRDNCDLDIKHTLEDAFAGLERMGFLDVEHILYSSDISKAFLCPEKEESLVDYARALGIPVKEDAGDKAAKIIERFGAKDERVDQKLKALVRLAETDPSKYMLNESEAVGVVKAADFLIANEEDLYIREASSLIFGSTKILEGIEGKVLSLLKADSLDAFHVFHTDSLIRFRGEVHLHFDDYAISVSDFLSGFVIGRDDLRERVRRIEVLKPYFITVENETSFLRHLPDNCASMFLSGFATNAQIEILRRVKEDNPGIRLYHFGDIDAGGLRIFEQLRRELGDVTAYHMGIEELANPKYKDCLLSLEDIDRRNLESMVDMHPKLIGYMLRNNCKLEQEIVSLDLEGGLR